MTVINCTNRPLNINGKIVEGNHRVGHQEYGRVYITNQHRYINRSDVFLLNEVLALGGHNAVQVDKTKRE